MDSKGQKKVKLASRIIAQRFPIFIVKLWCLRDATGENFLENFLQDHFFKKRSEVVHSLSLTAFIVRKLNVYVYTI